MIWYDMQKMDIHLENPQWQWVNHPLFEERNPENPHGTNLLRPKIPDKIGQILSHG